MQSKAQTISEYIHQVPEEKLDAFIKLRKTIRDNLPEGFTEEMSYGMIGYIVPLSIYSDGYHVNPNLPLPFINIAAQKKFIALYHMGIYANPDLLRWFSEEFPKYSNLKLDMGKGCIRFKNYNQIPYTLIAELVKKTGVKDWITLYESKLKRKNNQ
jgi:uncharacterized protein YdhG (YjbR/CyaY superfamily)